MSVKRCVFTTLRPKMSVGIKTDVFKHGTPAQVHPHVKNYIIYMYTYVLVKQYMYMYTHVLVKHDR